MKDKQYQINGANNRQSLNYWQTLIESTPIIGFLLVLSLVGYFILPTSWWFVIFIFGAIAAFTNRLFHQKAMNLREQLKSR